MPSRLLDDVQLLASELVTNGVLHADVGPGTDMVHVGVELASDALRLHVEDAGATGAIARRSPDVAAGTGYGLNIVATLASEWGISRTDSTRVWAELTWLS